MTLTYRRKASKYSDGSDGYLYAHHFGTGFQELVFGSHEQARRFAASENCEYRT